MTPWWRGAVIYHVYVRSFFDSDGDGHGDLPGVLAKLDYIESLGVDAIWLSPVHPSPDRDWGYDVSDFEGVHPDYGTLADFDALLAAAHGRGLRIILDEVLSHTSDEHAWFADSRDGGADGPRADWYVWADPQADGTAPNNWLSVFGGPAWAYQPARRQHYHHKFLRQQPKLNWRNAEAREAALAVLDTWLAHGVDGFRLDVAGSYLHDPALTDNPTVPGGARTAFNWSHAGNLQRHLHDANLPENLEALAAVRARVEAFDDRFVFGEFFEEEERGGAYATGGLHSAYTFVLLLADRLEPGFVRDHLETLARHPEHWPSISFSNHDVPRTATRFSAEAPREAAARLMFALLLALRGNALIYQGEELGLPEAQSLKRTELRDPVGDLYWPVARGRDGARTPMPWQADAPNLGFTSGKPWLPLAVEHVGLAVDEQSRAADSMLAFSRSMIALRKGSAALTRGEIELLDAPTPLLAFVRTAGTEAVACVFNMGPDPMQLAGRRFAGATVLSPGVGDPRLEDDVLTLGPYGVAFLRLSALSPRGGAD